MQPMHTTVHLIDGTYELFRYHYGLPAAALPGCRVVADVEGFRDEVIGLLRLSHDERRAISSRADLSSLTWEARLRPLPQMFETAARSSPTTAR